MWTEEDGRMPMLVGSMMFRFSNKSSYYYYRLSTTTDAVIMTAATTTIHTGSRTGGGRGGGDAPLPLTDPPGRARAKLS
uniref:Uncharacterized protein n=1 Tax=Oryza rufipogon TaxID=4529 RepID=A0A0E0PU18_ORYRU